MLKTRRLTTIAVLAASLLGGLSGAQSASAASAATGTVTANGYAQAGFAVYAYYYNASTGAWVKSPARATTDSAGRYTITGLTDGRSWYIQAYRQFGACFSNSGGIYAYNGNSGSFVARATTYRANVPVQFAGYLAYC